MAKKPNSRWRKGAERYSEKVYNLLRQVYAEPKGYHQGGRVKGAKAISEGGRLGLVIPFKQRALEKLAAGLGAKHG